MAYGLITGSAVDSADQPLTKWTFTEDSRLNSGVSITANPARFKDNSVNLGSVGGLSHYDLQPLRNSLYARGLSEFSKFPFADILGGGLL